MRNTSSKKLFFLIAVLLVIFVIFFLAFFNREEPSSQKKIYNKQVTRQFIDISNGNGIFTNIWFRDEKSLDLFVKNNMRYLFVDVGHIEENGKLITSKKEITSFIDFIKDYENKKNFNFVLIPYNEIILDDYDFSSEIFKENIIKNQINLIEFGFNGALIDIEAIPINQRREYLIFLEKLGNQIKNNLFFVYAGALHENPNKWEWDSEFYEEVSDKVDVILIPSYDFHLNNKKDYQEYLSNQIKNISSLDLNSELFFTLPTHKSYPETIENSLEIYNSQVTKNKMRFIGTVVFAEWTTDEFEWKVFENYQNFSF